MQLKQILYFLQIYRDESFTKAAANLAVTQPALSQQIGSLEKELGFILLERSAGKIQVTEKGRAFLRHAVDILDSFHNLESALKERDIPEQLIIAAGGAICGWVLPQIIAVMRKTNPQMKSQILEGDRNFIRQAILTGRSDFAISTEKIQDPRVESVYFCSDRIVPVMAANMQSPADYNHLGDFPFLFYHSGSSIQKIVDEHLNSLKLAGKLNVIMEIQSLTSLIKCVEAGLGIGFISELSISEKIKILPFQKLFCPRKFYIHFRKKRKSILAETAENMASIAQKLPNIARRDERRS